MSAQGETPSARSLHISKVNSIPKHQGALMAEYIPTAA